MESSKLGSKLCLLYLFAAGVEFNLLSLDYDIVPRSSELLYSFNKPNSKLYKYYTLPNYINTEYTILSGLLPSGEAKDAELNRDSIDLDLLIIDSAKSRLIEKRNLPSSLEIASDLDTLGLSLKKKARRISYYTRSTTRAILVNLDKKLDIVVLVLDILDLLEALENLREKASKVEVVEEVEF
ncbi:uncharacterized protein RCO7_11754 [Rhynchosporium graminicola]|uniref:Uncharacterized protein n=1 Tax=Rhynchosporium graminicola TaxID=2792576 RepID=A0A1E1LCM5_9HELO|nr:uncharacterized protein RCO7_11754 [Rhynchosporium commune]